MEGSSLPYSGPILRFYGLKIAKEKGGDAEEIGWRNTFGRPGHNAYTYNALVPWVCLCGPERCEMKRQMIRENPW